MLKKLRAVSALQMFVLVLLTSALALLSATVWNEFERLFGL